jgi:hypothetical protein
MNRAEGREMQATSMILAALFGMVGDDGPTAAEVRGAVERALPLIVRSVEEYPKHRDCFSCHHQAAPMVALDLARSRGLAVAEETISAITDVTQQDLTSAIGPYRELKGQGGGATRAGYALWTLHLAGKAADPTIDAVALYLLARDEDHGPWKTSSNRPPSEFSPFTTTYVALRGLQGYTREDDGPRVSSRHQKVREWLRDTPARENEERVFRLLGLRAVGLDDEARKAAADLIARQKEDGGWAQLDEADAASDAYATGTSLYALKTAGGVATDDPAYRRGLAFLIRTQREDGSWYVKSRSKAFQPYFESAFPYGNDQFISMAASSWATAALLLAMPAR